MQITQFPHLPQIIKIKIMPLESGEGYCAELPEYDVFTEADNPNDLDIMVNDLIFDLFSVPKEFQSKICYRKINKDDDFEKVREIMFLSTPEVSQKYFSHEN
jgi:hypothetical protein